MLLEALRTWTPMLVEALRTCGRANAAPLAEANFCY